MVTFNYRTNIFGFSGSPEIPTGMQNSGYLDQRFALQWVQDNIAQFGGDPTQITIFGESAGGYSVKQLLAHPPSPLPFRAAIMQSPQARLQSTAPSSYQKTLARFGCNTASSPIDCLRQVSALDLKAYITDNNLPFPPVNDNLTQSVNVGPAILSKQFADIPVLVGSNAHEGRVFAAIASLDKGISTTHSLLSFLFPIAPFMEEYLATIYSILSKTIFILSSAIITDYLYTCTVSPLSSLAVASGNKVWRYYYNASFPNLEPFPMAGSYHSSEIPLVFGTYPLVNATEQQMQLSKYLQSTWAAFAKNPEQGPGWSRQGTNEDLDLGEIGGRNENGQTTIDSREVDWVCGLYGLIVGLHDF